MKTHVRDDAISKNKKTLRVVTLACLAQSLTIVILACLTIYAFMSKETVYVPTSGGASYSLSELSVSPDYLRKMSSDVMQLRLTWNKDTIADKYSQLLSLLRPSEMPYMRRMLNKEIAAVKGREISSVFYQDRNGISVDVKNRIAVVTGSLQRIDNSVLLPLVQKNYKIKFKYVRGTLEIISIEETKHHA